jgi:hypothetical protein
MADKRAALDPRAAVDQLVAALLAAVDVGAFSSSVAARVAFLHVTRPERAGGLLPESLNAILRAQLDALAAHMVTNPDAHTLRAFANEATAVAQAMRPPPRHPGASLASPTIPVDDAGLLRAALYAESAGARDDDDLVRRAVTRALRERRRSRRGFARVPLENDDPLRAVLGLPAAGSLRLLRTDVRQHVANSSGPVGNVLRDAALFLPSTLRRALGEELYGLARILGFADTRRTRVLVGVSSSSVAQEVAMRKPDLLARLRRVPGFERVKDVRFEVTGPELR